MYPCALPTPVNDKKEIDFKVDYLRRVLVLVSVDIQIETSQCTHTHTKEKKKEGRKERKIRCISVPKHKGKLDLNKKKN